MTKVGSILEEFFSPFSSETLWVMQEADDYTDRVRKWGPVIDAVARIKGNLFTFCPQWATNYVANPDWEPSMTDSPKPGAHREFVAHPPGTEPEVCKAAFIIFAKSKAAGMLPYIGPMIREEQTDALYTCSIGSFNIYTTGDVDCANKSATLSFWMYNSMSKGSFGRFAKEPVFKLCGMKSQYMWWHWVENVEWSSGMIKDVPILPALGGW